jgi:threonine dehydratase
MRETLTPIPLADIEAARARLQGIALRTPLVRLGLPDASPQILLKLENLQPIGSFKLRGAANAMAVAGTAALTNGVYTASAGNMAQGLAWGARQIGVRCRVVVPETAPQTKLAAIERLGGEVIKVPFEAWWQTMLDHHYPGIEGLFIHPFADAAVMAGNGTIGLEILEDAPDVAAILVPYGGGGLSCGIASAVRASRPDVRVYAAEVETSAPFTAALAQGKPTTISSTPSFVDGIGGKNVFTEDVAVGPRAACGIARSLGGRDRCGSPPARRTQPGRRRGCRSGTRRGGLEPNHRCEDDRVRHQRRKHRQRHARHDPPWRDPDQGALTMDPVEYFPVADSLDRLKLPFSEAVRVGPMLYLSGAMGIDDTGALVPGGIEAETRQALENIRSVLERHSSSMDRVIKCTAMLADMEEWAAMNRVYVEHFSTNLPARSAFGASGLALGGRVEIECIATIE